jgi:hypothetical protein
MNSYNQTRIQVSGLMHLVEIKFLSGEAKPATQQSALLTNSVLEESPSHARKQRRLFADAFSQRKTPCKESPVEKKKLQIGCLEKCTNFQKHFQELFSNELKHM